MAELSAWKWVFLVLGSILAGVSKAGIAGLGVLTVAMFANVLPARESTGVLLPLLICGDLVAVALYRRHAVWPHLLKLSPWVAGGVVLGFFAMGHLQDEKLFRRFLGAILLGLVVSHLWRRRSTTSDRERGEDRIPHRLWFASLMGIMAGFTTMVANASGPIMILYFLAMRLSKMEFLGTGAWFFLCVNLLKVPFSYRLALITRGSLALDARLAVFVAAGTAVGRLLVGRIHQRQFETLALGFTTLAALRMFTGY